MIDTIFYILILLFSIVIHEVSHGFMAEYFGDDTARNEGRLTLNPVKHIDMFGSIILPAILVLSHAPFFFGWAKPVPYNPNNLRDLKWGTFWVAAAGVLSNFFIALVFGIGARLIPLAQEVKQFIALSLLTGNTAEITGILAVSVWPKIFLIFLIIILVNLALAIFNLVPIPPLDGSKILFSLLPYRFYNIMVAWEQYSLIILLVFIIYFADYLYPVLTTLFRLFTGLPL